MLRTALAAVMVVFGLSTVAAPAQADEVVVKGKGQLASVRLDHTRRAVKIVTTGAMPTELLLKVEARVKGRTRTFTAYWFDEGSTFYVYEGRFSNQKCSKPDRITWAGDQAVYRMSFPRRCFGNPSAVRVRGIAKPDPSYGGSADRTPWSRWARRG